ncbi:hypothetical protein DPMN_000259 [Dreissena polymorpha]|uniref:Integrase zinc-binding domain-containing protein n=1 Tax=Dreissena polymorpha TaxID=45954 RepID=A0A9D4RPS4_DREPO|nr:hypothetical protein DPMN_000259 [Dreissena polymorpha]
MLGLDFFKQYQCHIDLASEQILINGDRCSIKSKGASGCAGSTPASYDFKIEHRPRRLHGNADDLNWRQFRQCGEYCPDTRDVKPTVDIIEQRKPHDADILLDIVSAQNAYADVSRLKQWILDNARPNNADVAKCSPFLKTLLNQWERLEVRDDLVVWKWDVFGTNIVYWQVIVPFKQRRVVLKYMHGIKAPGHLGIKKRLKRLDNDITGLDYDMM